MALEFLSSVDPGDLVGMLSVAVLVTMVVLAYRTNRSRIRAGLLTASVMYLIATVAFWAFSFSEMTGADPLATPPIWLYGLGTSSMCLVAGFSFVASFKAMRYKLPLATNAVFATTMALLLGSYLIPYEGITLAFGLEYASIPTFYVSVALGLLTAVNLFRTQQRPAYVGSSPS